MGLLLQKLLQNGIILAFYYKQTFTYNTYAQNPLLVCFKTLYQLLKLYGIERDLTQCTRVLEKIKIAPSVNKSPPPLNVNQNVNYMTRRTRTCNLP
jgi:hypothetical protein